MAKTTSETVHTVALPVQVYYDENGEHACAKDFSAGAVCMFYRTQRFGTSETCVFAPDNGRYQVIMKRRGPDQMGSLIPGAWCPVAPLVRGCDD